MKNITILFISTLFVFSHTALAQTFSSEEEIDAYYDAQLQKVNDDLDEKTQAIEDQLQSDLDAITKDFDAKKWEMYKEVYGDQFEMVKPFLPESNPDPLYHANNLSSLTESEARRAIENIRVINPNLAKNIETIYNKQSTNGTLQKPSATSMFEYIDSLPLELTSEAYNKLKNGDPEMYNEVQYLINLKYPNGKPGSARHGEYLAKQTKVIVASMPEPVQADNTYTQTQSPNVTESEVPTPKPEATETSQTNLIAEDTPTAEQTSQPEPQPELKQNIFVRVFNFFKRWF